MAAKPDIVAGTITLTTGSATFTGTDTFWLFAGGIADGDTIIDVTGATEFMGVIHSIESNTSGTLSKPWEGPTVTADYRIRFMADGQRVTAQARNLIELLGNGRLTAIASAPETVGVIELLPGGAARLVPLTDLVSGANYDVQVANMAARAAYDGQTAGFAVLVADTGDGRAAIFSKLSNAGGDWSAAAYVTGPVGPPAEVTVGSTTTGAPGTPALVTPTPTPDGVELDFTIPAGEGFVFRGAYSGAAAYLKGDVVRYNNSSWIALQATTGNAPPVLPTTANANWELLAAAGANGTGTGDMVGPASSIDGDPVVFDGPTGKLARGGGIADPILSVSPIAIDMHFATLAGIGWTASEPGNIVATTTTAASSTNSIAVASASTFFVGQLICYVATDGQYYSVVIKGISGTTFTLDRILPVPIASGGSVYNFYRDDAHPNALGYACLVDDAIRQARISKDLVHVGANPAQWAAFGSVTLTNETTSSYAFPGSTVDVERAVRVTGSAIGAGVVSAAVRLDGGTHETQVVVNPGNRTGGFSGALDINVIATYSDGSTRTVATFTTPAFGDAVRSIVLTHRVPKGATVSVRVTNPNGGPWTFWVGMIRHSRIIGRLRELNRGRHVVFGDSWAAGGDFVTRLTARLPRATIINKGFSGDTSTNAVSRFDADMAGTNPAYVWVILGTNDVYAQVTPAVFQANIDAVTAKIQALGATPIIFNTSVCSLAFVPAPGPRLDLSRQYALRAQNQDTEARSGDFGTFTPLWTGSTTNPSIGNGTLTGTWTKNGRLVTCSISIVVGSTTNLGSGNWVFGISEPAVDPNALGGQGVFGFKFGTGAKAGMTRPGTATLISVVDAVSGSNWNSSVPFVWAAGDTISFTVVFMSAN